MDNEEIIVEGFTTEMVGLDPPFVPNNPLNRPKMNYVKPIIALLVFIAQFVGLCFIPYKTWWMALIVLSLYSIIYLSIIAKKTIIWLVHLYQNLAPDEVRLRCVFEPSCSEYMVLAIQKYGVVKGVIKGIDRMRRCGSEQGIDYPQGLIFNKI